MAAAGFRSVEVHTVSHRVPVPSVAAFWATNERSSAPLALLRRRFGAAEWTALGAEVVGRLEAEHGRGPVEMTWPARLGSGAR